MSRPSQQTSCNVSLSSLQKADSSPQPLTCCEAIVRLRDRANYPDLLDLSSEVLFEITRYTTNSDLFSFAQLHPRLEAICLGAFIKRTKVIEYGESVTVSPSDTLLQLSAGIDHLLWMVLASNKRCRLCLESLHLIRYKPEVERIVKGISSFLSVEIRFPGEDKQTKEEMKRLHHAVLQVLTLLGSCDEVRIVPSDVSFPQELEEEASTIPSPSFVSPPSHSEGFSDYILSPELEGRFSTFPFTSLPSPPSDHGIFREDLSEYMPHLQQVMNGVQKLHIISGLFGERNITGLLREIWPFLLRGQAMQSLLLVFGTPDFFRDIEPLIDFPGLESFELFMSIPMMLISPEFFARHPALRRLSLNSFEDDPPIENNPLQVLPPLKYLHLSANYRSWKLMDPASLNELHFDLNGDFVDFCSSVDSLSRPLQTLVAQNFAGQVTIQIPPLTHISIEHFTSSGCKCFISGPILKIHTLVVESLADLSTHTIIAFLTSWLKMFPDLQRLTVKSELCDLEEIDLNRFLTSLRTSSHKLRQFSCALGDWKRENYGRWYKELRKVV